MIYRCSFGLALMLLAAPAHAQTDLMCKGVKKTVDGKPSNDLNEVIYVRFDEGSGTLNNDFTQFTSDQCKFTENRISCVQEDEYNIEHTSIDRVTGKMKREVLLKRRGRKDGWLYFEFTCAPRPKAAF